MYLWLWRHILVLVSEEKKVHRLQDLQIILLENLNFSKCSHFIMAEMPIRELAVLYATISIRMSYSCFVNFTSHLPMVTLDKHFSQIGCLCYIMLCGQVGLACLLLFLIETQTTKHLWKHPLYIVLALRKFTLILECFGDTWGLHLSTDGSVTSSHY